MSRNGSNEMGQTLTFLDNFFVTDLSLVGKANGVSIDPCGKGYYFHAPLNPASQKTLRPFPSPITAQFQKYFFHLRPRLHHLTQIPQFHRLKMPLEWKNRKFLHIEKVLYRYRLPNLSIIASRTNRAGSSTS